MRILLNINLASEVLTLPDFYCKLYYITTLIALGDFGNEMAAAATCLLFISSLPPFDSNHHRPPGD